MEKQKHCQLVDQVTGLFAEAEQYFGFAFLYLLCLQENELLFIEKLSKQGKKI